MVTMPPLSRTPVVWTSSSGDKRQRVNEGIFVTTETLSDGSLLVFLQIGPGWLDCDLPVAKDRMKKQLAIVLRHIRTHNLGFAFLIHIKPNAGLTLEMVRYVNEYLKQMRTTLLNHLKGTMIVLPNPTIEVLIMTALAFLPPLKPLHTHVVTEVDHVAVTELGLPKSVQKTLLQQLVKLPWPDASATTTDNSDTVAARRTG